MKAVNIEQSPLKVGLVIRNLTGYINNLIFQQDKKNTRLMASVDVVKQPE